MKTGDIPVYTVSVFNNKQDAFWVDSIDRILERYAFLELPHKRMFYCILFIEKAEGTARLDNKVIRLDEPKIICVRPNSIFRLDINRNAKGSMICFTESFFSLRYNNNVLYQFVFLQQNDEDAVRIAEQQTGKWKILIGLMKEEIQLAQKGYQKVLRSLLNILLFDLDRQYKPSHYTERISSKEEKVVQFERLIEEQFKQHKTPSWYADKLNITANYLNRLCHEYRGNTSGELIRKRIIIEAQRLLHYTSLSVAEIAYQIGFDTPSYFITFFKKNTLTTPEQFRKKIT